MPKGLNELNSATTVDGSELLLVQQSGDDKAIDIATLASGYKLVRAGSGTVMPGSPSFADEFYRTDLDEWYKYNGATWIQI